MHETLFAVNALANICIDPRDTALSNGVREEMIDLDAKVDAKLMGLYAENFVIITVM